MTIKIGGLGQEISFYCPVCSEKMNHMCKVTLGTGSTIRYAYECNSCELEIKSDASGNAKLLKEVANV
jgi:transcription elongation factor Elf1